MFAILDVSSWQWSAFIEELYKLHNVKAHAPPGHTQLIDRFTQELNYYVNWSHDKFQSTDSVYTDVVNRFFQWASDNTENNIISLECLTGLQGLHVHALLWREEICDNQHDMVVLILLYKHGISVHIPPPMNVVNVH